MLSCKISEDYEILNKYYSVKYKGTITRMWTDDNRRPYFEVTPYNTSLYKKYVFCVTSEEYNKHIVGERVSLKKMVPKKDVVKEYVISDEENNYNTFNILNNLQLKIEKQKNIPCSLDIIDYFNTFDIFSQ